MLGVGADFTREPEIEYRRTAMNITEPALVVKINQTYRDGISTEELYEITRGIWKIDKRRRDSIRYVLGAANGLIREVYSVDHWQDAGTDPYYFREHTPESLEGRSEFVGGVAPDDIRDKYIGKPFSSYQAINYFDL